MRVEHFIIISQPSTQQETKLHSYYFLTVQQTLTRFSAYIQVCINICNLLMYTHIYYMIQYSFLYFCIWIKINLKESDLTMMNCFYNWEGNFLLGPKPSVIRWGLGFCSKMGEMAIAKIDVCYILWMVNNRQLVFEHLLATLVSSWNY